MRKILEVLLVALILVGIAMPILAETDYKWEPYDSAEVIRVKYTGTATATIQIAAAAVTVVDDGNSNTIALTSVTDVDDLVAAVAACTNAAGATNFECTKWAALGADTVSNKLVAAAADTLTPNRWEVHGKWDTSAVKHYDVVPSGWIYDSIQGGFVIDRIVGEPDGTGNVSVNVYRDDTVVWKKTIASPVYVTPEVISGTNDTTNATDNVVYLDEEIGIRADQGERYLIRATRATTATTGGIGVAIR